MKPFKKKSAGEYNDCNKGDNDYFKSLGPETGKNRLYPLDNQIEKVNKLLEYTEVFDIRNN